MRKSQLNGKAQPFLTTSGEAVANDNGFGCSSAALRNLWMTCFWKAMAKLTTLILILILTAPSALAQQPNKRELADEVKAEFLHAWNGYKKYAWDHDDLKPLSKTYRDWYAQPLLMTPVDALDTMIIMGMKR